MNTKTYPSFRKSQDRIVALDTLRGIALLGILIMNIQSFAMVSAAHTDPSVHMNLAGLNYVVWMLSHVLADSKFMAIFSILFGAGIIVFTQQREAKGQATWRLHYARNLWLFVFGLLHAYFIWYGDILLTYALAGMLIYWVRHLRPLTLTLLGLLVLSVTPLLSIGGFWTAQIAGAEAIDAFLSDVNVPPEVLLAEIEAYQGTWLDTHQQRVMTSLEVHAFAVPFYLFWRAAGLMLIGMALFKWDILSAKRSAPFYNRIILFGVASGLPLCVASALKSSATDWEPAFTMFGWGLLYIYVGSLGLAAAYIGLVMRLVQMQLWPRLQQRLSAVGRMAFTNYILQSVICTFIFYGFGLGLFGAVERSAQILIVFAIWSLQLILSPLWLARYRFGPLEWLWRSLTYWNWLPIRR